MAITNHERVGKSLELLRDGLHPFVERELRNEYGDGALLRAAQFVDDQRLDPNRSFSEWDVAVLLRLMWEAWNAVFRQTLGHAERSLVSELRETRNRWAHQNSFSSDDTYRALDSTERLLTAISAPQAAEIAKMKTELLRLRFDEQARNERRRTTSTTLESQASPGLKPWREVTSPHPDVASGRYQQAEFAADLWQVHLGDGPDEYLNPVEFFRRTFLTVSLQRLLSGAIDRLTGSGGDPVVQLQTNFGGGKTHSMLALYHLFSGVDATRLPGLEAVLQETGKTQLPPVRRVVLVGNKISPGNPVTKVDGTVVRTLWGEMAWQLGGREAFERIRADDELGTSPGDALRELFNQYGPALILIDEWVAYARQLHDHRDLPGGDFETHFSFAQVLTESAKTADHCLLVVSLPASESPSGSPNDGITNVEVGGARGQESLERLRNAIGRVEASWRPASAEEGFEIVRRRLFEPMIDKAQFVARDTVARAFGDLYRTQPQEFPPGCGDADYERRLQSAYPIHPEVFDRLYQEWSTLVKFQRTRGVLRLMAAVIHSLWEHGDKGPLILPSSIPIDDPRVQFELTRYLADGWVPVLDTDVEGPNSLPRRLDGEIPNLGKYSACRRVARTVYLGSAPVPDAANRGVEDRRIKLGCVLPGETPAIFGDALRRMSATATYLYQDGARYWYSTQPTVTRLADDRAEQLTREPDKVHAELDKRLRANLRESGDFKLVHPFPATSQDVPDGLEARLIVLNPEHPHSRDASSAALTAAKTILESRGNSPRIYRNTLVFLAVDRARLQDLDEAVRRYLAWKSILEDKETLNLTLHQIRQAEQQSQGAEGAISARIPEAYQWLITPTQSSPQSPVEWQSTRLTGTEPLAVRASKKLKGDELLVTFLAGTRLRLDLDKIPLWRGDHVPVSQLMEDFAKYIYLPRLRDPSVITQSIEDGVKLLTWNPDTFSYADRYDESGKRYLALRGGAPLTLRSDEAGGVVVKSAVALLQMDRERAPVIELQSPPPGPGVDGDPPPPGPPIGDPGPVPPPAPALPRRFHGSVVLDSARVGRDASRVAEEVIAHLATLREAGVRVTLEIEADLPDGAPENIVRIVTENSRTLRFDSAGFEVE
ncbi:MAG: Swt1 family HEPN domain-containing protein [Chloroflexota bacterium]